MLSSSVHILCQTQAKIRAIDRQAPEEILKGSSTEDTSTGLHHLRGMCRSFQLRQMGLEARDQQVMPEMGPLTRQQGHEG